MIQQLLRQSGAEQMQTHTKLSGPISPLQAETKQPSPDFEQITAAEILVILFPETQKINQEHFQ